MELSFDSFGPERNWRRNAACRDTDPTLFFPVGSTGTAAQQIASAKEVCVGCLSNDACLQFAIGSNQQTGVWGGTTEDERRNIRRRLRGQETAFA